MYRADSAGDSERELLGERDSRGGVGSGNTGGDARDRDGQRVTKEFSVYDLVLHRASARLGHRRVARAADHPGPGLLELPRAVERVFLRLRDDREIERVERNRLRRVCAVGQLEHERPRDPLGSAAGECRRRATDHAVAVKRDRTFVQRLRCAGSSSSQAAFRVQVYVNGAFGASPPELSPSVPPSGVGRDVLVVQATVSD
jgi:hypothetical protein